MFSGEIGYTIYERHYTLARKAIDVRIEKGKREFLESFLELYVYNKFSVPSILRHNRDIVKVRGRRVSLLGFGSFYE